MNFVSNITKQRNSYTEVALLKCILKEATVGCRYTQVIHTTCTSNVFASIQIPQHFTILNSLLVDIDVVGQFVLSARKISTWLSNLFFFSLFFFSIKIQLNFVTNQMLVLQSKVWKNEYLNCYFSSEAILLKFDLLLPGILFIHSISKL